MKPLTVLTMLSLILTIGAVMAPAQPVISAKSGMVSYHEGRVFLGDKLLEDSLTKFDDVKENAILRTEDGRAEVLLNPGVILRLGENSSFKMITSRFIDTRLEVLTGSATIVAEEIAKDTNVTVLCKDGSAAILKAGFYRFDTEPARLKVFAGSAMVTMGGQSVDVTGGKMLGLGGNVASVEKFDKEGTDPLDRWSHRRSEYLAMANVSAANSLRQNGSTLSSGIWQYNPYFGLMTFIPANGRLCNPIFNYCYWSPAAVARVYYVPPPMPTYNAGGGFGNSGYVGMPSTSGGYSGTMASSGSVSSVASAPAASASASTAASSAGSASAGHGSASSGGHGH
jgi:hypothetical protein